MASTPIADVPTVQVQFSVADGYDKVTTLAPGARPGRMTPVWWLMFLSSTALWTMSFYLMAVAEVGPYSGLGRTMSWVVVTAIVLWFPINALAASSCLKRAARRRFGQTRAANKVGWAPARIGMAATSLAWMATTPQPLAPYWPLIPVAWLLLEAITISRALGHARRRQEAIFRLRHSGRVAAGVLTQREFSNYWIWDQPCFRVTIQFPGPWGADTTVQARMFTSATQVPVIGTAVRILTDDHDAVLVDLDDLGSVEFEQDYKRWVPPEG